MRIPASALLTLLLSLCCLAACGGDDVADDPKLSQDGKEIVQAVGGPFTKDEFKKFLADLPEIPHLTAQSMQDAGDASGAVMNAAVRKAIASHGWDEDRFLYIYGHAMTVVNCEQMEGMAGQMADQFKDMPEEQRKAMEQMMAQQIGGQVEAFRAEVDKQVPASEQAIVRDNMDALKHLMGME